MKKKYVMMLGVLFLVIFNLTKINIYAANGVNIEADSYNLKVGESTKITVSTDANYLFEGSASASGAGTGSSSIGLFAGTEQTFYVTAHSTGQISVNVSGFSANIYDAEVKIPASAGLTINVTSPGGTGGDNGGTGGGNNGGTGGGNNNSGNNSGGVDNGVYNPNVDPETEEERIEREKREEEEKREQELKSSFIESITIKSEDESRKGSELKVIEGEDEKLDYEYNLPIFVNKVGLDVKAASDDVTLDYEKSIEVTDEKEVVIRATKGDLSQEFKLKLKPYDKEGKTVEDGFIYEDEKLTSAFKDLGFESKEFELDGKKSSMFNKNDLNLQMIVNEENEALFYRLDETGKFVEKGQIIVFEKDLLFVSSDVDDELKSKTLYGNGYSEVELDAPAFFVDIDESLKMNQISSGWKFEDGIVVVALDDKLEKDTYNIVAEKPFKAAVVAFDGESSPILVYALIGSVTLLLAVSIAFIAYYLKSKKRIQLLLNR